MKEGLTKRLADGSVEYENGGYIIRLYPQNEDCYNTEQKAILRLAEYEDLEEQGLVLRLPCKVGDTFYCKRYARIMENQVSEISTNGEGFGVYDLNGEWYHINEIFFMQAEAEKKLAELKGEKNNADITRK